MNLRSIAATFLFLTHSLSAMRLWTPISYMYVVSNKHKLQSNDLITLVQNTLKASGINVPIVYSTDLTSTLSTAKPNSALFYVTSPLPNISYPTNLNPITAEDYQMIADKNMTAYIEFPDCVMYRVNYSGPISCFPVSTIRTASYERGVFVTDKIANLPEFTILDTKQTSWVQINAMDNPKFFSTYDPFIYIGKWAGYDFTLFGLTGVPYDPMVFQTNYMQPTQPIFFAMNGMSNFNRGRYAPRYNLRAMMVYIINTIAQTNIPQSKFVWDIEPIVPQMGNDMKQSYIDGARYVSRSKLLVPYFYPDSNGRETPGKDTPIGDGTYGILEGFHSLINITGGHTQSTVLRTDCQGETAAGLAWADVFFEPDSAEAQFYLNVSWNLLNFVFYKSGAFMMGDSFDYALTGNLLWGVNGKGWNTTFYGDDNARGMLGSLIAMSRASKRMVVPQDMITRMVYAVVGNFRYTGTQGFRPRAYTISQAMSNGWKHYFNSGGVDPDPHFQSYLWVVYLYACEVSGYMEMCIRALEGINNTMIAFYDGNLLWCNGLTQEYARMMLPLSILVRTTRLSNYTSIAMKWLTDMGNEVAKYQDLSQNKDVGWVGSIQEHYGDLSKGSARPPQTNAQYGTGEAPLEQENGDPVSDTLYTCNFGLWGLHEACMATGGSLFCKHRDALVRFFTLSQTKSNVPELDYLAGSWYRAFDYKFLEYYSSSADWGWGPTSQESGWTHGEVLSAFGLIQSNMSLWDVLHDEPFHTDFRVLLEYYIPLFGLP